MGHHGMGHPHHGFGHPHGGSGRGEAWAAKLGARFVRDVTIFDGTQMAPGTPFTKIWRLKNTGEVPWPPGARMLFVGGDQMTTEMSVPLARETPVMPGEEVDVAIEMVAPTEHGRYLGYWRLTGPFMKRKFGQKVWCHVQVVDPSQSGAEAVEAFFEDLPSTLAEIARKKADLAAADDAADDAADAATDAAAAEAHLVTAKDINKDMGLGAADKAVEAAATEAAATMEAKVEALAAAPAPAPAALVSGE